MVEREISFVIVFLVYIFVLLPAISTVNSSINGEQVEIKSSDFPDAFLFGAATSAYQVIEGGFMEDGKSLSNWDVFCRLQGVNFEFGCLGELSGSIADGTNGDIADDHYHRYMEDIDIMHSLGLTAYRFSISWSRILPRGRFGGVNLVGIAFYNKIIDNLLLKGIEPFVTIFHNEYPQELEDRLGGWLSPLMQLRYPFFSYPDHFDVLQNNREEFVHFAKTCFEYFSDRVTYWITINEPNLFAENSYERAKYPPARCSPPFGDCPYGNSDIEPLIVVHNLLLGHAKAAKLYREQYKASTNDFELMQHKVNGVMSISVCAFMYVPLRDEEADKEAANRALAFNTGMPRFFVVPRGMEDIVAYVRERYQNKPMIITENGYSSPTNEDNIYQHDMKRINYHQSYLQYLARAIRKGADVRGYLIWSLMDNFEWSSGYDIKFGLYHVDRQTLKRSPKMSATWYRDFLSNATTASVKTAK
ncbi:beta glucosidase 11 [Striga asiatica]|uniref:Beta glucosidase 11 n=1 Tax=Striga asiatica TaxID=4170 RepID=A0A5A7RB43_STRAF|nr:beta glucosidase 11 [Striga asiatica]